MNHCQSKNIKAEALLLWAHHEKAGFSGRDSHAGKGGKAAGKAKYEMDGLPKGTTGLSLQEMSRAVDILEIAYSWGCLDNT